MSDTIRIRPAAATDVAQLIQFISELADYENRSYEMVADEASLQQWLFGEDPSLPWKHFASFLIRLFVNKCRSSSF